MQVQCRQLGTFPISQVLCHRSNPVEHVSNVQGSSFRGARFLFSWCPLETGTTEKPALIAEPSIARMIAET